MSRKSRILFVNDGSADSTWGIIQELARKDETFLGISQSRNRGHQNAVLAGLMEAREHCDITISIDCDGQDDVSAMERMVDAYLSGAEVVYGVRSSRKSDSFFKRITARSFYRLMNVLGAEVVYDHADYRLVSSRVLQEFADFHEVNLFLRGMIPLVGFPSASVSYERQERMAGSSHYPLRKMLQLAFDGIIPPDVEDAHKRRREMSEDMLRRSRFLVICGDVRNEEVEDDIAIARKAKVIVTTLKGVVGCA